MANRYRAGIMDSVIGGAGDAEAFERARWAGFTGVEVTPSREELASGKRLAAIRRALETTSLEVPSLVLDHHNLGGIGDADPTVAGRAADEVRAATVWAAELGAHAILVPFFARAELLGEDDFERAVAAFRALCPAAEAAGVSLLYEGTLPAHELLRLAGAVASPAFGCYFDTANLVLRALDPPTEIRALGDLIRQVHVKDVRAQKSDAHPGRGRVDFRECARALEEVGYEGWLVFETPAGPPPLAARDLSYVRYVFEDVEADRPWPVFGALIRDGSANEIVARLDGTDIRAVHLESAALERTLENPERARQQLAACGLEVAALGGYRNLVAPEASSRREGIEFVSRCLELAPALGTWVVSTHSGSRAGDGGWTDSRENASEDAWTDLCGALERLLPVAAEHDTVLALEGAAASVLKTPSQLLRLLDAYPSPHLQLVADPYNYFTAGLVPAQERVTREFLELFEDRFVLAHLKDVAVEDGETSRPEFGLGVFDQAPYLDFLRRRRPDLPLVFEHLPHAHLTDVTARAAALAHAD
jgi:sugar phosphate isomerase/epimerase